MQANSTESRYHSKRAAGISPVRSDGSTCDPETDRQSGAAEKFAAEFMGCEFNDSITEGGDGGYDFLFGDYEVDAVWLGFVEGTTTPRETGYLIVNPYEPQRWADVYILVRGSIETGFKVCGYTIHEKLIREPKRSFGYGFKFAMHISDLSPILEFLEAEYKIY